MFLCPLYFLQIAAEFRDLIDSGLIYLGQDYDTGGAANVKLLKNEFMSQDEIYLYVLNGLKFYHCFYPALPVQLTGCQKSDRKKFSKEDNIKKSEIYISIILCPLIKVLFQFLSTQKMK